MIRKPALPPQPGPPEVTSPCVGTCKLDARQICIGCQRTLAEIAEWPDAGPQRRLEIRGCAERRRLQGVQTKGST